MVLRVHSNTMSFRGKTGLTLPGPWRLTLKTERQVGYRIPGEACLENSNGYCGQKGELEPSGTNMERDQ